MKEESGGFLCVGCEAQQDPNQLPPAETPPPLAEEIPLKSSGSKTTLERDARERQQVSFDASCHTETAKFFFLFF